MLEGGFLHQVPFNGLVEKMVKAGHFPVDAGILPQAPDYNFNPVAVRRHGLLS